MGYKFELFGRLKNKHDALVPAGNNPQDLLGIPQLSQPEPLSSPIQPTATQPVPLSSPVPSASPPISSPVPSKSPQPTDPKNDEAKKLILDYSSKGLSEADIIKNLKTRGFTFDQIDIALSEALKSKVDDRGITSDGRLKDTTPESGDLETYHMPLPLSPSTKIDTPSSDDIEAMVERVVEDRVTSLKSLISGIDFSISEIKSEISDLDKSIRLLENKTDDKIGLVNTEIQKSNSRFEETEPKINSLEKAFKDIVPPLIKY